MPSQARKHRGLRTERVVAQYLSQWWKGAAVGRGNGKDIVNIPIDIEVKARTSFNPMEWLRQSRKRTEKSGELNVVVCRMNGQGEVVEDYLAFLKFSDLVQLLIKAGYADIQGDTVNLIPEDCSKCGGLKIKDSICRTCKVLDNDSR